MSSNLLGFLTGKTPLGNIIAAAGVGAIFFGLMVPGWFDWCAIRGAPSVRGVPANECFTQGLYHAPLAVHLALAAAGGAVGWALGAAWERHTRNCRSNAPQPK